MDLTAANTAIVLDSTADFPEAPERFPNWRVVPLYVRFGDESYRDYVDLAAHDFYEALVRQDWPRAYAALDPDTQKRHSPEQFARLAQQYRRGLGLEPQAVHVRSCEEHGAEAIAHVTLTGRAAGRQAHYRDAVSLRQTGAGWRVVLPATFGRGKSG